MGKNLYERFPEAASVFNACDNIRPETSETCFYGTEEQLKNTATTQPCLFAVELATAEVIKSAGAQPCAAAGFSLGEVAAATFCGMFSLEDGFRLVCRRGELMQGEAEKHDTFMAAVLRLSEDALREICAKYEGVYPVNFNCPGQITVSGLADNMQNFLADIKAAGGRAIPLKVSGAFHSPFMNEASKAFKEELEKAQIGKANITLYSDLTALPYGGDAAELLSKQICSPVMWEKLIRNMIADGIDEFIEIGPGKTLTNMIKKIDSAVKAQSAGDYLAEKGLC